MFRTSSHSRQDSDAYEVVDKNPGSSSSHVIEARTGFTTASRLIVQRQPLAEERLKMSSYAASPYEYHVSHLETRDEHRGRGLAKRLVAHVEGHYGPVCIESENDEFWSHMGYAPSEDGLWRRNS